MTRTDCHVRAAADNADMVAMLLAYGANPAATFRTQVDGQSVDTTCAAFAERHGKAKALAALRK